MVSFSVPAVHSVTSISCSASLVTSVHMVVVFGFLVMGFDWTSLQGSFASSYLVRYYFTFSMLVSHLFMLLSD